MEEVIIRVDSETLGTDGPDKQLLGKLTILNYHEDNFQEKLSAVTTALKGIYEDYIDGSVTITIITKMEHINV